MIVQLSSTCYEYTPGDTDVFFLPDNEGNPKPVSFVNFPRPTAPPQPSEKRYTRLEILPLQKMIAPVLAKYCGTGKFELCGSYRRQKPTVKDLDYVVQCSHETFLKIRLELTEWGIEFHRGAGEIMNGTINGIAVDFFRADPESYTSIIIWRTGSMNHNILCASIARKKGMKVLRTGIRLQDGSQVHPYSEQEFYDILGMNYIPPEKRDFV